MKQDFPGGPVVKNLPVGNRDADRENRPVSTAGKGSEGRAGRAVWKYTHYHM